MAGRIEDYALIGDCETAALVGRDGSIDWLCLPRFDSPACFAALLGTPDNGRWQIAPAGEVRATRRAYRQDTLVLDTEFETADGTVAVTDFMPHVRGAAPDLVRIVRGVRGRVRVRSEFIIRTDYGSIVPWVRREDGGIVAIAGPVAIRLTSPVETRGENFTTVAEFDVAEGETVPFVMTGYRSYDPPPPKIDPHAELTDTVARWRKWADRCHYKGPWRDLVVRSLLTLKALTYAPSGGIVAAATTSLPEHIGGVRNWDYRYCWLRDATLALLAFLHAGYTNEASDWQQWLLRSVAGDPTKTQIMYGLGGERRLTEYEIPWLTGYEGSKPVRVGNAAHEQFQLDVYGELSDAMYHARLAGLSPEMNGWNLERALVRFVEKAWDQPDEGLWEVRGPRQHFTHSKVMAWVALDRAIKSAQKWHLEGPVDCWKKVRREIHDRICRDGFDANLNSFVQAFGSKELDASLLMIPLVGFLPASDPRVAGTVAAVERTLLKNGFVARYDTSKTKDGLPPGEGAFLACTFWLADNYALAGRTDEARELFERLAGLCNDVGLLSEEYDPVAKRQVGNFPQAFSHVGLVNTAMNVATPHACPASRRSKG
ncbi:glycoside hydrolase family 15 protein [Fimbriiglobus ruber]|uniref:Trehalase n=1 Tax=Fimbriiglobus ruber TaxID=1908690 RepID=A0A225DGE7_9BACT|nr:glycoside hydrolase family 15 protein [Fimbriiglobus ruber]OWK36249.1 Glucoamylase [Fimbriiglobus ruber]